MKIARNKGMPTPKHKIPPATIRVHLCKEYKKVVQSIQLARPLQFNHDRSFDFETHNALFLPG
jgi:hypothetical protein